MHSTWTIIEIECNYQKVDTLGYTGRLVLLIHHLILLQQKAVQRNSILKITIPKVIRVTARYCLRFTGSPRMIPERASTAI